MTPFLAYLCFMPFPGDEWNTLRPCHHSPSWLAFSGAYCDLGIVLSALQVQPDGRGASAWDNLLCVHLSSQQLYREGKTSTLDLPKMKPVQKDKETYSRPHSEEVTTVALKSTSFNSKSMLTIITFDIITGHRDTERSALPIGLFSLGQAQLSSTASLPVS